MVPSLGLVGGIVVSRKVSSKSGGNRTDSSTRLDSTVETRLFNAGLNGGDTWIEGAVGGGRECARGRTVSIIFFFSPASSMQKCNIVDPAAGTWTEDHSRTMPYAGHE